MTERLKATADLMIKNRNIICENFGLESSYAQNLAAMIYTDCGMTAAADRLKEYREMIKGETRTFSVFRGGAKLAYASMLAVKGSTEFSFMKVKEAHQLLKKEFMSSQYLPHAAFVLAENKRPSEFEAVVKKSKEIYKMMKSSHRWLTSSDDCIFCVLYAIAERDWHELTKEAENCFEILKEHFSASNGTQALSHALAFSDAPAEDKCRKTVLLYDRLKERKYKFAMNIGIAVLGILAEMNPNTEEIVTDIIEVSDYLKTHKGFGLMMGKAQRLVYAAALVAIEYEEYYGSKLMRAVVFNCVIGWLAAQQAAAAAV